MRLQPMQRPRGAGQGERRTHPRDELDGGGAGADHRDPPTGQVHRVVPAGRVEGRARKLSRPEISGNDGTCSAPVAETTALVVNVSPSAVLTRQ
ncbi:hypothetical protein GCM10023075_47920 [Streptosporangium album]